MAGDWFGGGGLLFKQIKDQSTLICEIIFTLFCSLIRLFQLKLTNRSFSLNSRTSPVKKVPGFGGTNHSQTNPELSAAPANAGNSAPTEAAEGQARDEDQSPGVNVEESSNGSVQEQNGQMSNEAVNEEGDEQEENEEQTSEDVSRDNNLVDNPMETIQVRKGNWAR